MENSIIFKTDDGQDVTMYVIEEAKLNGNTYLLVSESEDDDEAVGYIMKQTEVSAAGEVSYVMVEDDNEIDAVAGLFEELLDGEVDLVPDDGQDQ